MQCLCIGVSECADDIVQCINDELQKLKNAKIKYMVNKLDCGDSASIICSVDVDENVGKKSVNPYDILKTYVSNALADFIIKKYEYKILERVINSNYCYFNASEKKEILQISLRIMKSDDNNFINSLLRMRRHNIIVCRLIEYFENTSTLILDGFVNFRLKDYKKDLEEIVDKAVDDFLMEREYREFIRLLRYFVDIQEPRFNTIHVIAGVDNRYILLDDAKREITDECIKEFLSEISEEDVNYDDLLVSSLITLAPRKLIIHGCGQFKNKELLETIKNVFSGKLVICNKCEICTLNMAKSKRK